MKKIRTVIVGFGFMGQTHCGNALAGNLAEVTAIVDPCDPAERLASIKGNQNTVRITAQDIAGIPHYTELAEALTKEKPDAAVIALPTKFHCEGVLEALRADCHVFVEKPLDISPDNCRLMNEEARSRQRVFAVGHVVRCIPEYEFLRETIRSGRLGRLRMAKLNRITGVPRWGNWSDPAFVRASGGALFDLQCHDIDVARYCLGEADDVQVLSALCREFSGNYTSALLRFGGTEISVEGGFVSPSAYPFSCGYQAFFEKGTLLAEQGKLSEITDAVRSVALSACDPYQKELELFFETVATGKKQIVCDGEDAAKTVELCCRIRELTEK